MYEDEPDKLIVPGLEQDFSTQIATRLRTQAAALVPVAARAFSQAEDVQRIVVQIGRESGSRITLVAPDGRVLADSAEDPALMDNHASRPELMAASLLSISPRVILYIVAQKYFIQGIATTGLKR